MLPTHTAVKIDDPNSRFHGTTGFIKANSNSGIVEPCDNHHAVAACLEENCEEAEELPDGWYAVIFDPMDAGGYAHCVEWFDESSLTVNGC